MDLKDIEKIMKLMDNHGLTQFKLEQDETKLELKKSGEIDIEAIQKLMPSAAAPQIYQTGPMPSANLGPADSGASSGASSVPPGMTEITSPMVGTFYVAKNPESEPYVKLGDKVTADTTVCMIEAMKVFNEIQAEVSGEIVDVLVENGTAVQYGEPLFLVKSS